MSSFDLRMNLDPEGVVVDDLELLGLLEEPAFICTAGNPPSEPRDRTTTSRRRP